MLDTHGRKFVQPIIKYLANIFICLGVTANQVTILAFLLGILASVLVYFGFPKLGVLILWFSGLLDAIDGSIARIKGSNLFGALMDVTFDRVVEITFVVALALRYPKYNFLFILLVSSIVISMTIFLTVGSLSNKISEKSFYYQAGVAERTEGFIFFSAMVLFPKYLKLILIIFVVIILFTAMQRMAEAKKILS